MIQEEENPFQHTMTDLMSGLAVIFLLVAACYVVMVSDSQKKQKVQADNYEELRTRLNNDIQRAKRIEDAIRLHFKESQGAQVVRNEQRDPLLIVIEFRDSGEGPNGLRFPSGSWGVGRDVQEFLSVWLKPLVVADFCSSWKEDIESIALEGHTDRQRNNSDGRHLRGGVTCDRAGPSGGKGCPERSFINNVELSTDRAQEVFFHLRHELESEANFEVVQCLDSLFVVSGRGSVEAQQDGPVDNPLDRKVVIKIRIRSSANDELRQSLSAHPAGEQ